MRLVQRRIRTVTVKPAAANTVYQANDRLYRFDDARAFAVRAVVQPMTEREKAAAYGKTPEARLLMLWNGGEPLEEGMGVCVDVQSDKPCDYRIAGMPRRYESHNECTLAFLPAEMRG